MTHGHGQKTFVEGYLALFRLLPPASLLVGHDGLNAIVMGGFE